MSVPRTKKAKMHRTQLFLPQELHKALTEEAQSQGITNSEVIRQLVTQYLHKTYRHESEAALRLLLEMAEV